MITAEVMDLRPAPPLRHQSSHTKLLDLHPQVPAPSDDHAVGIDAVIVPAARPTQSLATAIDLAAELGAACLALCSKSANAAEAAVLGKDAEVHVTAVQTGALTNVLPTFRSNKELEDAELHNDNAVDIARKRNLALLIARLSGWRRILFLDDDVLNVQPSDVQVAAQLLHDYDAVGLKNVGYPDNSVVYHANRELREEPGQFISTMALAISVGAQSFFPAIYNEDWFFFLGELPAGQWRPRLAAIGEVGQKEFDPFANVERARREEFGDTLAEGLFGLLDQQRPLKEAKTEYWDDVLEDRRSLIGRLLRGINSRSDWDFETRASRVAALEAALEQHDKITSGLCAAYVDAWRADLKTWRKFVADLTVAGEPSITSALQNLDLTTDTHMSF